MGSEWEFTHLCKKFGKDTCEYFLQTDTEKTALNGKTLDICSYYCTSENKVRKIGSGGAWTGLSPKFCPKRKALEEKSICDDCVNNDENCIKPSEDKCIGYTSESDTILNSAPESKPAYKDIFLEHYPNFDVSEFDEFAESLCVACCFDDGGAACPFPDDGGCKTHWESECLLKWRDKIDEYDLETINVFLIEQPSESETAESTSETSVAVQEESPTVQAAFDYSELDGDTADKLRAVSERVISIKAKYIIETAKQVKAAHDLLANCKNGMFGLWCKSVGFSRDTGDNLVRVAEVFPEFDIAENFGNISPSLLYEASKPSAPKELVEQVRNGDITTHKDYIALKKQLEEAAAKAENEEKAREAIRQNLNNMEEGYREYKDKYTEEYYKNQDLEKRVKELESRPVDVAVQRDETSLAEIARLNDELAKARQDIIDASFGNTASGDAELISDFYETLHGNALSAIRSCADFAEKNGGKFTSRFRSLAEVISDYINEMEEF